MRLLRLGQPRLGLLGAGLKPGPGLLARRDLRFQPGPQPGLVPLGVLAGLRHLLLRGPAHPVQLRPGRLGRLPRPRRVLPGLAGPGLGLGRPRLGSVARDCAPVTASSRSCRAAATCSRAASSAWATRAFAASRAVTASCSAAAFAASASASRASASAAAARASRASASASWRRRQNANPGRPGSPGSADPPPCRAIT